MTDEVFVSTKLSGKMKNMTSITTAMTSNPNCQKLSKCKGTICEHCYSHNALCYRRLVRERYEKNGEILSSRILDKKELPVLNCRFLRFETHGDIINETHLINYMNIAKVNPRTTCVLWTKQYDLVYNFFKENKAPKNFRLMISSLMINKEIDISKFKALGLDVKSFTVYDKEFAEEHNIKINCGARDCATCLKCYNKRNKQNINELLK